MCPDDTINMAGTWSCRRNNCSHVKSAITWPEKLEPAILLCVLCKTPIKEECGTLYKSQGVPVVAHAKCADKAFADYLKKLKL